MAQKKFNAAQEAARLFQRVQQGAGQIVQGVRKNPIGAVSNAMDFVSRGGFSPLNLAVNIPQTRQTFNDYSRGQVIQPIQQGIRDIVNKPGIFNKGMGGLNVAAGIYSATPPGIAWNAATGSIAGALNAARTRQPIRNIPQAMYRDITRPTDIGRVGLGIGEKPISVAGVNVAPAAALAVNVLAGNPKSLLKGANKLKYMVNPNQAPRMHPDDIKDASEAIIRLQQDAIENNARYAISGDKQKDMEVVRRIAGFYFNKKFAEGKSFQKIAQEVSNRIRVDLNSKERVVPDLGLGLVNDSESLGTKNVQALRSLPKESKILDKLPSAVKNKLFNNRKDMGTPQNLVGSKGSASTTKSLQAQEISGINASNRGLSAVGVAETNILKGNKPPLGLTGQGGSIGGPPSQGSSSKSIAQVPNSENPYFNTNKLNVSGKAKQQVNQVIQEVKPQIEKVVGKTLSNKEVINAANRSSKILHKAVDRAQTEDFTARLLRTRQQLAAAAESGTVTKEYIENLIAVKSHATDIGRKLQSFNIGADPKLITSKDAILDAVLKVEKDADKVIKAAEGVDFNDLKQATDFYRKFIKPTWTEKMDLVRYNSMLSSPNTHINNAASNFLNTSLIAPIEKTLTGTLDFLSSKATGKPQTQFPGEGTAYARGYVSSVRNAAHAFADVMRGKRITGNLDVRQIPLSTNRRVSTLNLPTRLLEAADQFFTALVEGGEKAALNLRKSKGVKVGNIETLALDNAKYRLFRSELNSDRQGALLNGIDELTGSLQKLRSSDRKLVSTIAKLTLPFVQTPMNILKQGIEYSPAGLLTLKGAPNKTEQLSKTMIGTSAAIATSMLVASGRTTWAEPTNPTARARFRAAGLQPYAVKIGDNWVSYAKLPPALSFPIAFLSAINDAEENKTIDQNQADVILNAAAKWGNFFADQSYMKNIGDLVAASKGSAENMTRFVSNYPQQFVPFRALLGWMARLTDPNQRMVNTDADFLTRQVQSLMMQIPLASQYTPARKDEFGQPIPNQNKEVNAFSPFRVTTERPEFKSFYDSKRKESLLNKNLDAAEKMIEKGETVDFGNIAGAAETVSTKDLQMQLEDKVAVKQVRLSGQPIEKNGKLYYPKGSSVKMIDLTRKLEDPQFSGKTELDKQELSRFQSEITKRKNEVADLIELGRLTPEQGETILVGLKQKLENIKDQMPSDTSKFKPLQLTGNETIDKELISKQVSAYSSEINKIVGYVTEGKLTPEQGDDLIKRIRIKQNELKGRGKSTGGGRKAKKVNYGSVATTAKAIKVPNLKVKIPKTRIPKYKPIKTKRFKVKRITKNI